MFKINRCMSIQVMFIFDDFTLEDEEEDGKGVVNAKSINIR